MAAPWPARTWLQSCAGSPSHATSGIDSNSQATTHSIGHRSRAALCGGEGEEQAVFALFMQLPIERVDFVRALYQVDLSQRFEDWPVGL